MSTPLAGTAEPQAKTQDQAASEPATPPETDWKAQAKEWERRARGNSAAAKRLAEIEESQKTEAQKAADALAAAQREAEAARLDALRYRVGAAKGLPPEVVGRLQGTTEDELAADADVLAALLKPSAPPVAGRPTAPQSGAVPPDGNPLPANNNDLFRRFLGNQGS